MEQTVALLVLCVALVSYVVLKSRVIDTHDFKGTSRLIAAAIIVVFYIGSTVAVTLLLEAYKAR